MGEMSKDESRALGDAVRASTADLTVVVSHHTIGATGYDLVTDLTHNMGGFPWSYAYHLAGHLHFVASTLRMLIWNDNPIVSVVVKITGEVVVSRVYAKGEHTSPVYVFPWDASAVPDGTHRIEVVVTDSAGRNSSSTDWFSLDGTVVSTETATSYAIKMRILVKGWSVWLMLYALVFVCFVAGSLAFGLLVRRWGGVQSPVLDKLGAAFGPVAVAWMASCESGRATLGEYFEAEKLSWWQKLLAISTWQFQYSMWQMSFIPAWRRAVYCAIAVLHVAAPICFSPYPSGWAATWPWGSIIDSHYHQNEYGMAFSILFCGGVFYPTLSIDASRSHCSERKPGVYHWLFLVLAMACAIVIAFGIGAWPEGYSLLLSPMVWSTVVLMALNWHLMLRAHGICKCRPRPWEDSPLEAEMAERSAAPTPAQSAQSSAGPAAPAQQPLPAESEESLPDRGHTE
eukprot:m51a1_g325 hypothetical protein (456) ;mRNA; f:452035-453967